MHFSIVHTIRYSYSRPVFLEPHEVRLHPGHSGCQRVWEFNLQVDPLPAGMTHYLDAESNNATNVWFAGEHEALTFTTRGQVETTRENPFDFLPLQERNALPLQYDESLAHLLAPALEYPQDDRQNYVASEVASFVMDIAQQADGQLLPFLDVLNQTIYTEFECLHRETGEPWPPAQTLAGRRGACRDFAVLFVAACRQLGIAARFVSGYQEGDREQDRRELHAWAEAYVPGGGWRGYDPTHGLAVADRHVAVAASASPRNATPVMGSFRGTNATATIETEIELQIDQAPPKIQQIQQQQQ